MSTVTSKQKLMIVRLAQDMARDANMRSSHGRAIREAAIGFQQSHIPDNMTIQDASDLIRKMQDATEFFGSNETAVMEVAEIIKKMKAA
jgi:hypothetical protein